LAGVAAVDGNLIPRAVEVIRRSGCSRAPAALSAADLSGCSIL